MHPDADYATVSEAINKLRLKGFTVDFNLEETQFAGSTKKIKPSDLEIVAVYRYEGDSDPGDEATVYALESRNGIKGFLVTGYGVNVDTKTTEFLKDIHSRI